MAADEIVATDRAGTPVRRLVIGSGSLHAVVLSYGAVIQDLRLDGHGPPLVLGFDRFEDYRDRALYFGALVGRYANRIRNGRFVIDDRSFAIEPDHPERQGLHGGSLGTSHRHWTVEAHTADAVTLSRVEPDGTMGFPGTLSVRCTYRVVDDALGMEVEARADAPTLCNFAQHSYFNLDDGGQGTILDHRLEIAADAFLPVDAELIPTGEIAGVAGTPLDFRELRTVRFAARTDPVPYDHNMCLSTDRRGLSYAARLEGGCSGIAMELWTTEPGLQFYSGHLTPPGTPGLSGIDYRPYSGLCLEAQVWPDSPNRPAFPQAVIRPGEVYRQRTEYRFSRN